ncbi:MAG: GIY-YIG nuclease family protein [candidate division Zixibacteria bacterium]|nr:GIY-YIG nuclease family protein [candidate division Zixibacteria bacterium]
MKAPWFVYILQCRDQSYYTGITKDVDRRLDSHNLGRGARYTRSRRPCRLVYVEECKNESAARRREREIKSWRRERKRKLINEFSPVTT